MKRWLRSLSIVLVALSLAACGGSASPAPAPAASSATDQGGSLITTPSGLKYEDLVVGTGALPAPTDLVTVHYTGTLQDGTVFDASRMHGGPVSFPLNQVIKGWTEGVGSMKVGGTRKLVIPPALGYGNQAQGSIPANSTLTFIVELLDVPKVKIEDTQVGTGAEAVSGKTLSVYYTGKLENGKVHAQASKEAKFFNSIYDLGDGEIDFPAVRAAKRECGGCHDQARECDGCHGIRLGQLHHRMPAGFLIASRHQGIEGQGIGVRDGTLLFRQRTQDAEFNRR